MVPNGRATKSGKEEQVVVGDVRTAHVAHIRQRPLELNLVRVELHIGHDGDP